LRAYVQRSLVGRYCGMVEQCTGRTRSELGKNGFSIQWSASLHHSRTARADVEGVFEPSATAHFW